MLVTVTENIDFHHKETVFPYDVIQSCLSVSLLGGGVVFAYLQQSEGEMCIFFS